MWIGGCDTVVGVEPTSRAYVSYIKTFQRGPRPMSVPWRTRSAGLVAAEQSAEADARGVPVAGTETDPDGLGNRSSRVSRRSRVAVGG
jgi:hypothetical protein